MGPENAQRMLGPEGWAPTAKEAKEAGLVQDVVPHAELMDRAQEKAEQWVKEKKIRSLIEQKRVQEYKDVNWKEVCILRIPFAVWKNYTIITNANAICKLHKGPDKMFKTQLNCAPYVAPSDLKEIQHLVRAFSLTIFFPS